MAVAPVTAKMGWSVGDGDGGTDGPIKTANTARDGTGTVNLIYTAGASGANVTRVRFVSCGTNVASVGRVFINNGSTPTNQDNNALWAEVTLPATTASEEAALTWYEVYGPVYLPAAYRLYAVIGTTVAAGWRVIAEGVDY